MFDSFWHMHKIHVKHIHIYLERNKHIGTLTLNATQLIYKRINIIYTHAYTKMHYIRKYMHFIIHYCIPSIYNTIHLFCSTHNQHTYMHANRELMIC